VNNAKLTSASEHGRGLLRENYQLGLRMQPRLYHVSLILTRSNESRWHECREFRRKLILPNPLRVTGVQRDARSPISISIGNRIEIKSNRNYKSVLATTAPEN